MQCEIDKIDACAADPPPCTSKHKNSQCLDTYENYYCSCPTPVFGKNCTKTAGHWKAGTLYVDANADSQRKNCGRRDKPCKNIDAVLGMVDHGAIIELVPSSVVYQLRDHTWLSKGLTVQGPSTYMTQDASDKVMLSTGLGFFISPSSDNEKIHVTFQRLQIDNSSMMIGDAMVSFIQVELNKVEIIQQYIKPKSVEFDLSFENSAVYESIIATRPQTADTMNWGTQKSFYQPIFCTVSSGSLTIKNSDIFSSSFNLTAKQLTVEVADTVFSNEKICPNEMTRKKQGILPLLDRHSFEETSMCKEELERKGILDTGLHLAVGFSLPQIDNKQDACTKSEPKQYRVKRQSSSESSKSKSKILIRHTSFSAMVQEALTNQGAVTIVTRHEFEILLNNCTFDSNERAVSIDVQGGFGGSIDVKSSNFTSNKAWGPGGAIHLNQVSGHTTLTVENTTFTANMALGITDKLALKFEQNVNNRTFEKVELSKMSGSGGALAINVKENVDAVTCTAVIKYCTFERNSAENYGGTMYITSGVTMTLLDNRFRNLADRSTIKRPKIGDIIESRGNIIVTYTEFNVTSAQSDIPIFSYKADRDDAFLQTDEVDFLCPKGYQADEVLNTVKSQAKNQPIETLMLYCRACSQGKYSLEFAKIRLTKERIVHEKNRTCKGKSKNIT